MTAWARLYRPLNDALPRAALSSRQIARAAEQDARGITAIFADGTRATGDLLVARRRPALHGPPASPAAGQARLCGLCRLARRSPPRPRSPTDRALLFESNAFSIPGGELAVSYPVPARDGDLRPGKRDYNIVWYRPTDAAALADLNTDASGRRHEQIPPPLIRPDVIAAVKADARALLAPSIADIFVARRAADLSADPRFRIAPAGIRPGRAARRCGIRRATSCRRRRYQGGARRHVPGGCARGHETIDAALADYNRVRQRAGSWAVARSREFGACVSAEVSATGCRPPQQAQRSESVFREYAELHAEVREWSKDAFESEAFKSDAVKSSESSRPRSPSATWRSRP